MGIGLRSSASTASVLGFLDEVVDGKLVGWALNRANREEPVHVSVYVDDELAGSAICNDHRPDLQTAGMGTGQHGFRIPLAPQYLDDQEHRVDVRLPSGRSVNNSPRTLVLPSSWVRTNELDPFVALANHLVTSGLIDASWYLEQNPDVRAAGAEPGQHYLLHGDREGRHPNRYFNPHWYAERYGIDPANGRALLDYVERGEQLDQNPCLYFDVAWYRKEYGLDSSAGALAHFLSNRSTASPNQYFSSERYRGMHPLSPEAEKDPFWYWLQHGIREGQSPSSSFDTNWVLKSYLPGVTHLNPFLAFLDRGQHEGWLPVAPRAEVLEGALDLLTRDVAIGWIWNTAHPDDTIVVEAWLGEKHLGTATANQLRPDLLEWKKGTGHYGFTLSFKYTLEGDEAPRLCPAGRRGEWLFDLVELPPSAPSTAIVQPIIGAEGHVDSITSAGAVGWAWNPSTPTQRVMVEARIAGRSVGRAIADLPRPDLAKWGKGDGSYGYALRFTEPLQGRTPTFHVLVDSGATLSGGTAPADDANASLQAGTLEDLVLDHARFTSPGPSFEEFDPEILAELRRAPEETLPLLVAFYLPQFHPIAENDAFWGRGFTEWRQLARGMPRYPNHYQPRIPRDLGFYDLTSVEVLRRQAEMAQQAGIGAFAYYYYWFNRKRVLDRPLEDLLTSNVAMPFFVIWANENWTRTWDGAETAVLLRQDYREEDEGALIADLARHFRDPRYVRIGGRPLFVLYNPKHVPSAQATIDRWRDRFRVEHGEQPLMFMAQTFGERDPWPYGLDGAMEFPPHKLCDRLPGRATPDAYSSEFTGRVINYDDLIHASLADEVTSYPLLKTIVPSWDNDSRRPNRGLSFERATPDKYENWLYSLIRSAIERPIEGRPIVAINAWNEWAEGAYLEPDVYYGGAYLNATARAMLRAARPSRDATYVTGNRNDIPKVSAILPCFNHARFLAERIASVISQTRRPDEVIFLDDCSTDDSVTIARALLADAGIPHRIVVNETNSGCVFLQWLRGIDLAAHDVLWIAETDDSAADDFLEKVLPWMGSEAISAAFGRIRCMNEAGEPIADLDSYFDQLTHFSWDRSNVITAHLAFEHDFVVRNVIPNASGLVFRKPVVSEAERERLCQYRFAGDWFFYGLLLRGGSLAFEASATSWFRVNRKSTSRSAFFTERHVAEHAMILEDLSRMYSVSDAALHAHVALLGNQIGNDDSLSRRLLPKTDSPSRPLRICVAAHGFDVGGGEILPLELANCLRARGHHVTYLVREPTLSPKNVRSRLRRDISIVHWDSVQNRLNEFFSDYGFDVVNSHNVSIDYSLFCSHDRSTIPFVASLHGGYETVPHLLTPEFLEFLRNRVSSWLYLADKNLVPLGPAGIEPSRQHRSFNAVERPSSQVERLGFRKTHQIPPHAIVGCICSRAIEDKGWADAIEAVLLARAHCDQPICLLLIGDGPARAALQERYSGHEGLLFLGHIENPRELLPACDFGIFPSRFAGETFPLFLVECAHAGLPVIASNIGEIPRMLGIEEPQPAGVIVDCSDTRSRRVEKLAMEVVRLARDSEWLDRLRQGADAVAARYSMDSLTDYYLEVFRSVSSPTLESVSAVEES